MVQSVILTGPTAVGKTGIAIEVAKRLDLEIINADSVCFYEKFNIGSAKPSLEEQNEVPHHLIDVAHPNETYHAGRFLRDCKRVLHDIHQKGKRAIIVGGSGFYLKSLRLGLWDAPPTSPEFRAAKESLETEQLFQELKILDSAHAEKVGGQDRYRIIRALEIIHLSGKRPSELQATMSPEPNPDFELWVVDRDPKELDLRIRERIQKMLDAGLVSETLSLSENYPNSKTLHSVGYEQVLLHLAGIKPQGRKVKPGIPGLVDEIELAHRQLAKQQRTWLKNLKPNHRFTLEQDHDLLKEKLMNFYQ